MHHHHGDGLPGWVQVGLVLFFLVMAVLQLRLCLTTPDRLPRALPLAIHVGMAVGMATMVLPRPLPGPVLAAGSLAFAVGGGWSLALLAAEWPKNAEDRGRDLLAAAGMAYMLNPFGALDGLDLVFAAAFALLAGNTVIHLTPLRPPTVPKPSVAAGGVNAAMEISMVVMFLLKP